MLDGGELNKEVFSMLLRRNVARTEKPTRTKHIRKMQYVDFLVAYSNASDNHSGLRCDADGKLVRAGRTAGSSTAVEKRMKKLFPVLVECDMCHKTVNSMQTLVAKGRPGFKAGGLKCPECGEWWIEFPKS